MPRSKYKIFSSWSYRLAEHSFATLTVGFIVTILPIAIDYIHDLPKLYSTITSIPALFAFGASIFALFLGVAVNLIYSVRANRNRGIASLKRELTQAYLSALVNSITNPNQPKGRRP